MFASERKLASAATPCTRVETFLSAIHAIARGSSAASFGRLNHTALPPHNALYAALSDGRSTRNGFVAVDFAAPRVAARICSRVLRTANEASNACAGLPRSKK